MDPGEVKLSLYERSRNNYIHCLHTTGGSYHDIAAKFLTGLPAGFTQEQWDDAVASSWELPIRKYESANLKTRIGFIARCLWARGSATPRQTVPSNVEIS